MASNLPKKTAKQVANIELTEASATTPLHSPLNHDLCACGAPVATELGQNQVCAKHIKAN